MILNLDNWKFDIDLDKTRAYYKTNSLGDSTALRVFSSQASVKYPKLTAILERLGVDVEKPDDIGMKKPDGSVDHSSASYTVFGSILEYDQYEIDIFDSTTVSIVADDRYVPSGRFVLTVYGFKLIV